MPKYNKMELMICLASRYLEDNSTVVVGTGAPCATAMLAQKVSAPNLMVFFEAGGVGPILPSMPISVGDSRTFYKGIAAGSMAEIMESCQRGMADYTFLGGAQIDMYGNINSTLIGEYEEPRVRFPGSGGANDLASLCWRTLVITLQNKKRFTNNLDFITSPGYLSGKGCREKEGLPPGGGPYKIITDLAVMGFEPETCRICVESIHPNVSRKDVQDNTGFELLWAPELTFSKPPTQKELHLLRTQVDPLGYIIGRTY